MKWNFYRIFFIFFIFVMGKGVIKMFSDQNPYVYASSKYLPLPLRPPSLCAGSQALSCWIFSYLNLSPPHCSIKSLCVFSLSLSLFLTKNNKMDERNSRSLCLQMPFLMSKTSQPTDHPTDQRTDIRGHTEVTLPTGLSQKGEKIHWHILALA